jgi:steroid delta-isomerase
MAAPIETAIAEYFGALETLDIERYVNSFAPDGVSHDPVGTPPLVGHHALRAFLTAVKGGFQSGGLKINNVFICGNSAAVKWTGNGMGVNGKAVSFEGVDVVECNDEGKLTTVRAYWDPGPVMAILQS